MGPIGLLLAIPALVQVRPAGAAEFLTLPQAQETLFPGLALTPAPLRLTDAQTSAIEERSDVSVRHKRLNAWRSPDGGWFLLDEVLGKHEYITYALGLTGEGEVKDFAVMEYRESYGSEVREASWRRQFAGKTGAAPMKLGQDVQNISGATLSSKHVTDGIRRLLVTWDIALKGR